MMKQNLGISDRILRVALGLGILGSGWYLGGAWSLVGLVPLITGLLGFCPLYGPLRLDTRCRACRPR